MSLERRQSATDEASDLATLTADALVRSAGGTLVADYVALVRRHQALAVSLVEVRSELDQLIYVASHDLRAPLRGITHLSEWIEEDFQTALQPDPTESAAALTAIGANFKLLRGRVRRLDLLIDGLLAYGRAGRGVFGDAGAGVSTVADGSGRTLIDLCEELLDNPAAPLTREDRERVSLIPGPGSELRLANVPALRVVLAHLLANASRHGQHAGDDTAPAKVQVTISACEAPDGGLAQSMVAAPPKLVLVKVTDNGPGIDARYHTRIWELFQTLEPRDRSEAAGVGLAIVKLLVTREGGTVGVDSAVGRGAAFRFTWPEMPQATPPNSPGR